MKRYPIGSAAIQRPRPSESENPRCRGRESWYRISLATTVTTATQGDQALKAQDIMTQTLFTIRNNQTLNDAAQLMWEHDCGWLPVVDESNCVVAALTDRDIAMAAFLNGQPLSELPVSIAQSRALVACSPQDSIARVEEIMQSHRVRRLPVIDNSDALVGVVSLNDLAMPYKVSRKGSAAIPLSDTLAAICSHEQLVGPMVAVA